MFERILVPLDGSDLAGAIIAQVRRILLYKDSELILVRAVTIPPSVEADTVELPSILQAQASKYLAEVAGVLTSQGARVRTVSRMGTPAEVILDVAGEEKVSLITISTHGRSGIARWAFGSVAEKILRSSRVPVLAVRSFTGSGAGAARIGVGELSLKRILVPLTPAEESLEVVGPAIELAKLFGSRVVLLNVCEGPACTIPVPEMTAAYERFHAAGVSVEPLMKQGDPAAQILDACSEQKADLIAMTTHGRGGVSRWMLGSVTEKVLRASTVPLLVVRPAKTTVSKEEGERKVQGAKAT